MAGLSTTGWVREPTLRPSCILKAGWERMERFRRAPSLPALWRCRCRAPPHRPEPVIPATADFERDSALAHTVVFETTADVRVIENHNELRIHTWGDRLCCLSRDARELFLYRDNAGVAVRPDLIGGEYLLIEEVRSPTNRLARGCRPETPPGAAHRECPADRGSGVHFGGRRRHTLPADQSRRSAAALAEGDLRQSTDTRLPALHFG